MVPEPRRHWIFDRELSEQLLRTVSILTIHPIKSVAGYFFPFIDAMISGYYKIRPFDPAQRAMIPPRTQERLLRDVQVLKNHAGIRRDVDVYTGIGHKFYSCGGELSMPWCNPLVVVPIHRAIRPEGPNYGDEPAADGLQNGDGLQPLRLPVPVLEAPPAPGDLLAAPPIEENNFALTDDETRFFIARELAHIKRNDTLLRVAVKIAITVAVYFMYSSPFGFIAGILMGLVAVGLYLASERFYQKKVDVEGAKILGAYLNDDQRAAQIAIRALEKIRDHNLARRNYSHYAKFFTTPDGNLWIDLDPFITTRIALLQEHQRELLHRARPLQQAVVI